MTEDSSGQFEISAAIWVALLLVGGGVFTGMALLFVKIAMRRRVNDMKVGARRATKVVDAWSESAKRMDGAS